MTEGFTNLWPTTFLSRQLPGTEAPNQALVELLLSLDQQHSSATAAGPAGAQGASLTSNYLEQDLLSVEHPAIQWLAACINKTVGDYLRQTGVSIDVSWQLQVWANLNRRGDYHNLHNHPHAYLSGTYYVQVPTDSSDNYGSRTDLNPNAISFFDPRPQANMVAIMGDPQVDPEHRVDPQAGQIMLWPSFLHHLVHPNLSDETRVSVSFNVVLDKSSVNASR